MGTPTKLPTRSEPGRPRAISPCLPYPEGRRRGTPGTVGAPSYSRAMVQDTAGPPAPERLDAPFVRMLEEPGIAPEEVVLEGQAPAGPSLSPSRAADFMT